MSGRAAPLRVLLVESLDSAGAAPADARARMRAIEAAGASVRAVAVDLGDRAREPDGSRPSADLAVTRGFADGRRAVEHVLQGFHPGFALVASAALGGGPAGRWLPPDLPALWWPSGLSGDLGAAGHPKPEPAPLPPLASSRTAGAQAVREDADALEWSVYDNGRPGRSLSLWDGDYLLAPIALAGSAGADVLHAFAAVAREWDTLDLVVLADPQPEFVRLVRSLGVGTRVHFAGDSPREAEGTWIGSAHGVILAGAGPLSSGLVLRCLARGRPVLAHGASGTSRAVRAWLERHGCALGGGEVGEDLSGMIEQLLSHTEAVRDVVARGRELVLRHEPEAMGPRIAGALDPGQAPGLRAA